MGYYGNLLDQIMQVEKEGFNPYSESYTARIGQLDTPRGEGGLEPPEKTPQPTSVPDSTGPVTEDQYLQAWGDYGQSQSLVTQAFQQKYPDVDIGSILKESMGNKEFSNQDLDKYSKELTSKYGELLLTADEVKKASPDYYKNLNIIKQKEQSDQTRGDKEKDAEEELFGWRNLLERRYKKGEEPYKYLDDITDEEVVKEAKKKDKKP